MSSVVEICNIALVLNGQKTIVSLDDKSPEANACLVLWPAVRNAILRGHRWNCVTRRAKLQRLVEVPDFGYKYYYQLPSKCHAVLDTVPDSDFVVEGKKLLSNDESVSIIYIHVDDDSTIYDAQLVLGMGHKLGAALAVPMTGSSSAAERLDAKGDALISDAKATDALEGKTYQNKNRRWIAAKNGG